MANEYYTILTKKGLEKTANTTTPITLKEIAVGDGDGAYYEPVESQTALKKEVWRGTINLTTVNPDNSKQIISEVNIPSTAGPFTIRELGLFDLDGDLIAIGKYPETFMTAKTSGSVKDLIIRMIIEVANATSVNVTIDPNVAVASRNYVLQQKAELTQQLAQIVKLIYPAMTTQQEIQNSISSGGHFKFIGGAFSVDLIYSDPFDSYKCAFIVPSNTIIEFDEKTTIELKNHNADKYKVFACTDIENVRFINVSINGRKDLNSATTGEWGMGISLRGVNNVYLENVTVTNCWGDGIYIGSTTNQNYCANVIIERFKLNNNRRQGISLISAKKLIIRDGEISGTNGVNPSDGMDIEPNVNTEFLQGIVIDNVTTRDNFGSGIKIFLGFYEGSLNEIDITIRNHKDFYSEHGFRIRNYIPNVKGLVKLENCIWENNKTAPFYAQRLASNGVRVEAHDCTVIWTADSLITSSVAFLISREVASIDNYRLGNVHLYRPNLIVKGVAPYRGIFLDPVNSECIENVSIIDPVSLPVEDNLQLSITKIGGNVVVSDKNKVLHREVTSNISYTNPRFKRTYSNEGATARVTVAINRTDLGMVMELSNLTTHGLRISPTVPIYPISPSAVAFETTEIGACIELKGYLDGWIVTKVVGNWSLIS